jgi:hypothetical protein
VALVAVQAVAAAVRTPVVVIQVEALGRLIKVAPVADVHRARPAALAVVALTLWEVMSLI